jgi:hypothetical protein
MAVEMLAEPVVSWFLREKSPSTRNPPKKIATEGAILSKDQEKYGRDGRIRTADFLLPKQAR